MVFSEILDLYNNNKIDIYELSSYLSNIKNKIIKNYPLLDFIIYENDFIKILKECLNTYDENIDFAKYYYDELNKYFKKINKHVEYKLTTNYLNKTFNFSVNNTTSLIKELDKFLTFLVNHDVLLDYSLYEKIFAEYKSLASLLKDVIAPTNTVKYKYLKKICTKEYVLEFLELFLGLCNIDIEDEIVEYQSSSLNTSQLLKHKLLTKAQTYELITKYKNGDIKARDELMAHNYKLVARIANRYSYNLQSLTFDDLFQVGVEGLLKALERFDLETNLNFSTYATWWIKNKITRYIMDNDKSIRIPVHLQTTMSKINNVKNRLETELKREVSNEEIALELGITLEELNYWYTINNVSSLNEKVNNDSDSDELGSFIKNDYNLEQEVIEADTIRLINEIIDTFPFKEREILKMRLGLGYNRSYSLEEIGKRFNVTRERIRQIEKKAKIRLNRKNIISDEEYDFRLSLSVTKLKLNDYFLGISTPELKEFMETIPLNYKKTIYYYYDKNLKFIYGNVSTSSIFLEEIVPYIFMSLYELDGEGNIKPLIDLFKDMNLEVLQKYINSKKLELITKRYGVNLNELNVLSKEELKKLYTLEIPKLYNFYISKKTKSVAKGISLKAKYNFLTFDELILCIKKLNTAEEEIVYQIYSSNLDKYNSDNKNDKVLKKLDKIINNYLDEKKQALKPKNGEVIIISPKKTFLEKYHQYDLVTLKSVIDSLGEYRDIIYLRYGDNLDQFNEIDPLSKKKLMEGLECLEKELKKLEYEEMEISNMPKKRGQTLLEKYPAGSKEQLISYIKQLTGSEQKIIFQIFGDNLDIVNTCPKDDRYRLTNALNRLDRLINGKKIKTGRNGKCMVVSSPKSLIARYHLELAELEKYIIQIPNYHVLYLRFGDKLDELKDISQEETKVLIKVLNDLEALIPKKYRVTPENPKEIASSQALNETVEVPVSTSPNQNNVASKRKGPQGIPLKDIYPNLSLEELKGYIKLLSKAQQEAVYEICGENLDEYHFISKKQKNNFNIAKARLKNIILNVEDKKMQKISLKYKYPHLSLEDLKKYIAKLPNNMQAVIYEAFGVNLDEYHSSLNRTLLSKAKVKLDELITLGLEVDQSETNSIEDNGVIEENEVQTEVLASEEPQDLSVENTFMIEESLKCLSVKHYIVYMIIEGKFNGRKYTPEQVAKMYDLDTNEVLNIYNEAYELCKNIKRMILRRT